MSARALRLHAANIVAWTVLASCAVAVGNDIAALFGMAVAAAFGVHACTREATP